MFNIKLMVLLCSSFCVQSLFSANQKKNVLFIGVDDLRPALGCYGNDQVKSPAIDKFASRSVTFTHAYCQYPVCNPSRRSVLSGLRPQRFEYHKLLSEVAPDHITMPGYFKRNGYYTASIGKMYHGKNEDFASWTYCDEVGPWQNYGNPENYKKKPMPTLEYENLPDTAYSDGKATQVAIRKIRENKGGPFFIGVGYRKPHLPFAAPKKYWDLYDLHKIKIPDDTSAPEGCTEYVYKWSEMFAYTPTAFAFIPTNQNDDDLTKIPFDTNTLQELTQGYYACVSFIDAQINLLLTELKSQGLDKNTVVVLWSDHGWNLGEQHIIGKHTCYEFSCRVPLIILDPGNPNNGKICSSFVELIDLFPTLSELCGLPSPPEYDGVSLVPLLNQVNSSISDYAFTAYRPHSKSVKTMLGTSLRSDQFRFTEWRDLETNEIKGKELYEITNKGNEKVNLVNQAKYNDLVSRYSGIVNDSILSWHIYPAKK